MNSVTKLTSAAALALLLGALATSYAGPSPQYWNRSSPATKPAAKVAMTCAGCKDTAVVAPSDRGPAGKGVAHWTTTGTKHDCTVCDTARAHVAKAAPTGSAPVHATQCGAMGCCPVASR